MTTTEQETTETIRYTADVVAVTLYDGIRGLARRIIGRSRIRSVLLIQRDWPPHQGAHALPGGHVDPGETSRRAGARELLEETGVRVDPASLRQLGAWDEPDRDERGRYVTVAYLAIVPVGTQLTAGDDARLALWWPVRGLPRTAFDHDHIIDAARRTI